jgi:hypothetical protein
VIYSSYESPQTCLLSSTVGIAAGVSQSQKSQLNPLDTITSSMVSLTFESFRSFNNKPML